MHVFYIKCNNAMVFILTYSLNGKNVWMLFCFFFAYFFGLFYQNYSQDLILN